jgi:hypothetical protein
VTPEEMKSRASNWLGQLDSDTAHRIAAEWAMTAEICERLDKLIAQVDGPPGNLGPPNYVDRAVGSLQGIHPDTEPIAGGLDWQWVDIDQLRYGVNRPQSWIDEHPEFTEYIEKLVKEVPKNGVRKPLIATDDGEVQTGNRMLYALHKLGWKNVPVRYKD